MRQAFEAEANALEAAGVRCVLLTGRAEVDGLVVLAENMWPASHRLLVLVRCHHRWIIIPPIAPRVIALARHAAGRAHYTQRYHYGSWAKRAAVIDIIDRRYDNKTTLNNI